LPELSSCVVLAQLGAPFETPSEYSSGRALPASVTPKSQYESSTIGMPMPSP
jgi:hypothetical protein